MELTIRLPVQREEQDVMILYMRWEGDDCVPAMSRRDDTDRFEIIEEMAGEVGGLLDGVPVQIFCLHHSHHMENPPDRFKLRLKFKFEIPSLFFSFHSSSSPFCAGLETFLVKPLLSSFRHFLISFL